MGGYLESISQLPNYTLLINTPITNIITTSNIYVCATIERAVDIMSATCISDLLCANECAHRLIFKLE